MDPCEQRMMGGLQPRLAVLLLGSLTAFGLMPPAGASSFEAVVRLLDTRSCKRCELQDADLVRADLRDADLRNALLQRANLSGARLDGAKLGGANLSFTSLQGASLRGADLRGATLEGTDLREADLSGAQVDTGSLATTHWQGARGIDPALQGHAELHNAGVAAAKAGRLPEAERFFDAAIQRDQEAAISWVARGIVRGEQAKTEQAAADFSYAAQLYATSGDLATSEQLLEASAKLKKDPRQGKDGGNGFGSQVVGGAMGVVQFLLPLAAKAFIPLAF